MYVNGTEKQCSIVLESSHFGGNLHGSDLAHLISSRTFASASQCAPL